MPVRYPDPADLEPIERVSRDELLALQLERLRWSLQHAYERYAGKVEPLRYHLRAEQDVRFPFSKSVEDRVVRALAARRVEIHA